MIAKVEDHDFLSQLKILLSYMELCTKMNFECTDKKTFEEQKLLVERGMEKCITRINIQCLLGLPLPTLSPFCKLGAEFLFHAGQALLNVRTLERIYTLVSEPLFEKHNHAAMRICQIIGDTLFFNENIKTADSKNLEPAADAKNTKNDVNTKDVENVLDTCGTVTPADSETLGNLKDSCETKNRKNMKIFVNCENSENTAGSRDAEIRKERENEKSRGGKEKIGMNKSFQHRKSSEDSAAFLLDRCAAGLKLCKQIADEKFTDCTLVRSLMIKDVNEEYLRFFSYCLRFAQCSLLFPL